MGGTMVVNPSSWDITPTSIVIYPLVSGTALPTMFPLLNFLFAWFNT